MISNSATRLLQGHDTIESSYYLKPLSDCRLNFEQLAVQRESLRQLAKRERKEIELGSLSFLLLPNGSSSGYPFVLINPDFAIECGENNNPSFHVKFHSAALWRDGIEILHERFLDWAKEMRFKAIRSETLGRVDFTFDYQLPVIDFDRDSIVTFSEKDSSYRSQGKEQTICYGKGDVVLRIYDKIAEIVEKSDKTWFFPIWGVSENVWRIEWQVRKTVLRRFGIRTIVDLLAQQGDLLRYLSHEHDTLRIPSDDSNRSRWPLHPLWTDLQEQIANLNSNGIYREIDQKGLLQERMARMAISVFGYLKTIAAYDSVVKDHTATTYLDALGYLSRQFNHLHDPLDWEADIKKRAATVRLEPL